MDYSKTWHQQNHLIVLVCMPANMWWIICQCFHIDDIFKLYFAIENIYLILNTHIFVCACVRDIHFSESLLLLIEKLCCWKYVASSVYISYLFFHRVKLRNCKSESYQAAVCELSLQLFVSTWRCTIQLGFVNCWMCMIISTFSKPTVTRIIVHLFISCPLITVYACWGWIMF